MIEDATAAPGERRSGPIQYIDTPFGRVEVESVNIQSDPNGSALRSGRVQRIVISGSIR